VTALALVTTAGLAVTMPRGAPIAPREASIFRKMEGKQKNLPPDKLPRWYGRHPNPTKKEYLPLKIPGKVQRPTRREAALRQKLRKADTPDAAEFEKAIQVFANRARQEVQWLPVQRREFMRRAKRWAGEMLLQDLAPSAPTLRSLLLGCSSVGDVSGSQFYVEWMQRNNRKLGRLEYNAVITTHAVEGNPEQANEWLQRMREAGVRPDAKSYAGVVEAWERVGNRKGMLEGILAMREAEAMGELGEPMDPHDAALPYYAMARSYVKVADSPRALAVLKYLQAAGVPLTVEAHKLRLEGHLRTPPGPRRSVTEIERAFRDVVKYGPKGGPLYSKRLARMCRYALGQARYKAILEEMGVSEEAVTPDLPSSESARTWRRASIQAALRKRECTGVSAIKRASNKDEKWFERRLQARRGAKLGKVAGGIRVPGESGLPEWMTLTRPELHGY